MKLPAYRVFWAALLTICLAGAAGARAIKVGMVLPLSGGGAQFGDQIEKGAMLYYNLHKADLGDNTITIIKRDSKNPGGSVAKAATQELIVRDKVELLTGYAYSPNAISIAPLVTKADIPVVIMNAGTAWITNLSPNIARVSFTMWQSGYIMGEYAAGQMGCKQAVSGYTNYPPGKDSVAAFKRGFEGAGGKVIDDIPMGGPRDVPDFTPFFQRAKDQQPNCFYGRDHPSPGEQTRQARHRPHLSDRFALRRPQRTGQSLSRRRRAHPQVVSEARRLLELLRLTQDAQQPVAELPYGRQRLVEIASALALQPNVLLLDEPAAGVPGPKATLF